MQTERRKFSSSFKAKVAIEALREQQTLSELSVKYELHPNQITDWKKQLLSGSEQIFSSGKPLQDKAKQKNEKDELYHFYIYNSPIYMDVDLSKVNIHQYMGLAIYKLLD